jgi:hypothetical protein
LPNPTWEPLAAGDLTAQKPHDDASPEAGDTDDAARTTNDGAYPDRAGDTDDAASPKPAGKDGAPQVAADLTERHRNPGITGLMNQVELGLRPGALVFPASAIGDESTIIETRDGTRALVPIPELDAESPVEVAINPDPQARTITLNPTQLCLIPTRQR